MSFIVVQKKTDIMQVNEGVKKTIIVPSAQRRETCIMQLKLKHMFSISTQSLTLLCAVIHRPTPGPPNNIIHYITLLDFKIILILWA